MKNKGKIRKYFVRFLGLSILPTLLVSCGSYYTYYSDGIYGEAPAVQYLEVVEHYPAPPRQQTTVVKSNRYSDFFRDKAQQYNNPDESFTHFTNVDGYASNSYTAPEQQSYAGWGNNPSQVVVNVYDNDYYWRNPYYGYNSYWGYGAWYPSSYRYDYYGYPYYRNRVNWGISIGWGGYYDPYWGWSGYYNPYWGYAYGGYYPYYRGYYPYYGGRYYSRDYYYDRGSSYNRNYGSYYGGGRAIVRDNSRRGDSNRYYNYENSRSTQGSYNRTTVPSRGYESRSGNYNNRNNSGNYQNNNYNNSTRGYESRYNSNSSNTNRSYESNSSRSFDNSGSSGSSRSSSSGSSGGGHRSSNRR